MLIAFDQLCLSVIFFCFLSSCNNSSGAMQVKKHMVSGKIMSRGFGFIEFDCVETARNACQSFQVIYI